MCEVLSRFRPFFSSFPWRYFTNLLGNLVFMMPLGSTMNSGIIFSSVQRLLRCCSIRFRFISFHFSVSSCVLFDSWHFFLIFMHVHLFRDEFACDGWHFLNFLIRMFFFFVFLWQVDWFSKQCAGFTLLYLKSRFLFKFETFSKFSN